MDGWLLAVVDVAGDGLRPDGTSSGFDSNEMSTDWPWNAGMAAAPGFHGLEGSSAAVNDAPIPGQGCTAHHTNLLLVSENPLAFQLAKRLVPAASRASIVVRVAAL